MTGKSFSKSTTACGSHRNGGISGEADSFIGISTPFTPVVVWVSPLKVKEITLEDAKARLSGQLEAKVRGFELKADDYRRDA